MLMEALATAKGAERQCLLRLANALKSAKTEKKPKCTKFP